jgi:hypothetical protein
MANARRTGITVGLAAMLAFTTVSCGSSGGSKAATTSTSSTITSPNGTAPPTPPPVVAGRTKWVDVTSHWKALAPEPFDESPAAVADDLAALRRGEDTSEVGQVRVVAIEKGEPLRITLTETGVPDIAVVQVDTEITLEGGDQGWAVSRVRQQLACRNAPGADATTCPAS